jgi:chlorite dismutase
MTLQEGAAGVRRVSFNAGNRGEWRMSEMRAVTGPGLAPFERLEAFAPEEEAGAVWSLSGVSSHKRYTTREEAVWMDSRPAPLGRSGARAAALIPIRKSPAWWSLAQDDRRAIFQESSAHISIGMDYVPRVARFLIHCRDGGGPFDFLTWFEFDPAHTPAFDDMLARLRATEEWLFVDREVDLRLVRAEA